MISTRRGLLGISPVIIFLLLYVVVSVVQGDFYVMPFSVALIVASAWAVVISRGSITERLEVFSRAAGHSNIIYMIWIFILAGAFASLAKEMGAVDATVDLTLRYLPASMLVPGMFVAACFISLAVGTSVGTVVALAPLSAEIASGAGVSGAFMIAVVLGGAFFGDNLSFISDTTVVATQTQGCKMSDKFRANLFIAAPAAIMVFLLYMIIGSNAGSPASVPDVDFLKVMPYLVVLVMAAAGLNVLTVLTIGIMLTGMIGIMDGAFDVFGWMQAMNTGILGMSELIIVTMLAGGMLETVRENGGINIIINLLTRHIDSRRGGEAAIAALVTIVNFCTANNTVAILTVGPIARQIAERFRIDPRRSASILDSFSCFAQGIIPYGAQLLMAGGLAAIAPIEIIPYLFYPYALGLCATVAIITGRPRRFTDK